MLSRIRALLAGLWAGALITIGLLAAPTLFEMLDKAVAGQIAGRFFFLEAKLSLLTSAALLVFERAIVRRESSAAQGRAQSQFSVNLALLLGTLLSVIVGYEVLHPMMEAARQGQGSWTFLQLHAASMGFYAVRTLLVLTLAWRSLGRIASP